MKGTGSVINAIDKTYTNNKNGREEKSQELDYRTE